MGFIVTIVVLILAIGFVGFLLPSIVGVLVGISLIKGGSVIGGLLAIAAGVVINLIMFFGASAEGSGGYSDEECPYCGSSATDGNHCHDCGEDF